MADNDDGTVPLVRRAYRELAETVAYIPPDVVTAIMFGCSQAEVAAERERLAEEGHRFEPVFTGIGQVGFQNFFVHPRRAQMLLRMEQQKIGSQWA